jgi:hypothetical protein
VSADETAAWRAAVHEAAHCVACWVLNIRIEIVELYKAGGGTTRAHLFRNAKSPETYDEADRALTVLLAGGCAERHLYGRAELHQHDLELVDSMLAPFGISPDAERAWRKRCRREAREIVEANFNRVEKIADALMQRGTLTGGDVARMLGPSKVMVRYGKINVSTAKRDAFRREAKHSVVMDGNLVGEVLVKGGGIIEAFRLDGQRRVSVGRFPSLAEAARAI